MKTTRSSGSRRSDILIILLATLVVAAVSTLGLLAYVHRDNRWVQVVAPTSDTAVEIVAVNRALRPYVRTAGGTLFLCGGTTWRDTCQPVSASEVPSVELPERWRTCPAGTFPQTPVLAGSVVDSVEGGRCQEARTYGKVVLLSDGTLWQWQRSYSWVSSFALASGIALSLVLGALLGFAIIRLRRYLAEPAPSGGPQPVA